ncbi:MAG: sulfur relay protein DsrC [Gammaproteobacteria bacterium]|nr:sulfur relay protein DsrC [Gammaproteobacteria bacterium]
MLILSEVLIQNHQLESYSDLISFIQARAKEGEMFFDIDVKPPYPDTPEEWESELEIKFTSAPR